MDIEKLKAEYAKFKETFEGFGVLTLLSEAGEILYTDDPAAIAPEEAKELLDAWLHTKPAVIVAGNRFPVLKWDPLQFAARNVKGAGSIVGSITKSKNYCIVFYHGTGNLIQTSIDFNRWVFLDAGESI